MWQFQAVISLKTSLKLTLKVNTLKKPHSAALSWVLLKGFLIKRGGPNKMQITQQTTNIAHLEHGSCCHLLAHVPPSECGPGICQGQQQHGLLPEQHLEPCLQRTAAPCLGLTHSSTWEEEWARRWAVGGIPKPQTQ